MALGSVMSTEACAMTRSRWVELFGTPTEQEGSVNEPRAKVDAGVRWNEKWTYREVGRRDRIVLWYRYDLVGVFRVEEDGRWTADPDPVAFA